MTLVETGSPAEDELRRRIVNLEAHQRLADDARRARYRPARGRLFAVSAAIMLDGRVRSRTEG